MIVVWLDPGLLTGMCVYDLTGDFLVHLDEHNSYNTGQLIEYAGAGQRASVGWESYTIMKGPQTQAPWSLEVIGMAKYLCARHGHEVLPEAAPKAREVCTTSMLRKMGWYSQVKGKKDALSSAQHMVAWMIRTGTVPDRYKDAIFGDL